MANNNKLKGSKVLKGLPNNRESHANTDSMSGEILTTLNLSDSFRTPPDSGGLFPIVQNQRKNRRNVL